MITFSSGISVKCLGENHFVEEYGDYWRLNRRLVGERQVVSDNYFQKFTHQRLLRNWAMIEK